MNSYSTGGAFLDTGKPQTTLLYVFIPLLLGAFIDICFTQIMGTQFCSLNEGIYSCSIHGVKVPQWEREIVRCALQFGLIMCAFLFLMNYYLSVVIPLHTSLFGGIGLVLFWLSQPDLFSDFRRLCNGAVFAIKHN